MIEILPFLKTLISAPGLSGNEAPIRQIVADAWRPLVDEVTVSRLGSLHALRRGSTPTAVERRPRILLAAHMDAIGMIVAGIEDGFLRFTQIGGVDPRILPGQRVKVHGREDLLGVVALPPNPLLPPGSADRPVGMDRLWIDTGLEPDRVNQLVRVGDLVSFDQPPLELSGDALAGHSLDNRASVAALTACLIDLGSRRHAWDVWAVATVQEEVSFGGASTSGFELRPDIAIAVDVTFGKGPGASDYNTFGLNKGMTLGWGPNTHPGIFKTFKDLAEELEIPYQIEVMPRHSGTDAYALQVVAEGIPSMVIGIPLRYMHTPVEVVGLKDINRTGRLLAEFITRLEPDTLQKIRLDNSL